MKKLILVRHAKSSWENDDWTDFERPLNDRGNKDAPIMADAIKDKGINPGLIISSPANRAVTTAKTYAQVLGYPEEAIITDMGIYEKGPKYIISLLKKTERKYDTVMLFGHNPDITSLASYFSGNHFDNVPTCGIVGIEFKINNWDDVETENGELSFFEYPKKYKERLEA
ncbi:MAG: SixA phosphatase family protein [Candidatus Kapaibacterium sp.]